MKVIRLNKVYIINETGHQSGVSSFKKGSFNKGIFIPDWWDGEYHTKPVGNVVQIKGKYVTKTKKGLGFLKNKKG